MEIKQICKDDSPSEIHSIPEDLINEILVRLPVKSLLKFRSVSKSWRYLISCKQFVQSHLESSTKNADHHSILLSHDTYLRSLNAMLCNEDNVAEQIDCPLKDLTEVRLIGSCNGLCCVIAKQCSKTVDILLERLCFWNPSTRMFRILPCFESETKRYPLRVGFGFVGGDYKVLVCYTARYPEVYIVKLYSLRTDSWKRVDTLMPGIYIPPQFAKCVNRKLYWLIYKPVTIVYFDLEIESWGTIQPPGDLNMNCISHCSSGMEVLGERLCLCHFHNRTRTDVWILEKDGLEDEFWNNIISFDLQFCDTEPILSIPKPVCMPREGEILISYQLSGQMTVFRIYDLRSKSFKPLCYEN